MRKKVFNYSPKGNPRQEKFLVSSSPEQYATISRTFFANGNLFEITDVDGIKKTLTYDSEKLFPITEITSHGGVSLSTARQFDRLTGEIISETGHNGVGTVKAHDDFGRVIRESLRAADGSETAAQTYQYVLEEKRINLYGVNRNVLFLTTKTWKWEEGYPDTHTIPAQVTYSDPSGNVFQECNRGSEGKYRVVRHKIAQAGREEGQTEPALREDCAFIGSIDSSLRLFKTKKDLQGRLTYIDPPPGDSGSPMGDVSISYSTNLDGHLVKDSSFANGQTKMEIFNDIERLEKVVDSNASPLRYEYNAAGDLRYVYGIGGELLTTIEYDLLG
ncbi:MAG: hypothetical protein Q7S00_08065, partial [bacterium]|nr:hypothetical protein [bacterium]